MGSTLAFNSGFHSILIFDLSVLTTLFLQVLSNLANDYGDTVKGTDNVNRLGPERSVQSGKISLSKMKRAVIITASLALASGVLLLLYSFPEFNIAQLGFFILGLGAIVAAIKYTIGKNPYGYSGFGDIFVFIFFGWVGVVGVFFLQTNYFTYWTFLPATTIGMFSVGVLNLNNLRDIENDAASNKITIVVKMGKQKAQTYHLVLIVLGWLSHSIYTYLFAHTLWEWLFVFALPIFFLNIKKVFTHKDPKELIPSLKQLALGTFLFCLLYSLGSVIGNV